ncbi:SAM hydrolase/SAM-dependent halogenase family protein [Myroides sp. LJL119]
MRRIITLTTDFGYKDYYVGALKGKIYSNIPNCNIVDISHQISQYNVEEAGFVIAAAYKNFPKHSVHIIAVDASVSEFTPAVCVKYDDHYFITANNGILTQLLQNQQQQQAVLISQDSNMSSDDLFVYCAYQLFENKPLNQIGVLSDQIHKLSRLGDCLDLQQNAIIGKIAYEDSFGNLVSNISKKDFEQIGKGRNFEIVVKNYTIKRINRYFSDFNTSETSSLKEKAGEFIALFNDLDLLTVGLFYSRPNTPGGSPGTLMNIQLHDNISVVFAVESKDK